EATAGPAEVRLKDLPDVHTGRHAQRVEHDVDGRTVLEERHILDGHDHRHDTLVAVAASHLVTGLDLPLHRDEDLDHLHHAGRQLIAPLQLVDLVDKPALKVILRFLVLLMDVLNLCLSFLIHTADLAPLPARNYGEHVHGDSTPRP